MSEFTGSAGTQVVWYFERPTVIVCEACEVPLHFQDKVCPKCKGEVTYFIKEEE